MLAQEFSGRGQVHTALRHSPEWWRLAHHGALLRASGARRLIPYRSSATAGIWRSAARSTEASWRAGIGKPYVAGRAPHERFQRAAATDGVACFLPDSEERAVVPSYGLRRLCHSRAGRQIECRGYPQLGHTLSPSLVAAPGESGRASPDPVGSAPPEIPLRTSRADRRRTYGAVAGRSTTLAAAYWP